MLLDISTSIIIFFYILRIHVQAQIIEATSISFKIEDLQVLESQLNQSNILAFPMTVFLGTPQQSELTYILLENPFPFSVRGPTQNLFVNSKCTLANRCRYVYFLQEGQTFFDENKSSTLQKLDEGTFEPINIKEEHIYAIGTYVQDEFSFFSQGQPIQLPFISLSRLEPEYVGNGVLILSPSNSNSIFSKGYLEGSLISPKFSIDLRLNEVVILFNQINEKIEQSPVQKTNSIDYWDSKIIGFYYGDQDIMTIVHYQTLVIQTRETILLPEQSSNSLKNCENCSCVNNIFEPIKVYISEYLLEFQPSQYFHASSYMNCLILTNPTNLVLSLEEMKRFQINFNTLDGSMQLPEAKYMIHPEISAMYSICGLSSTYLLITILLVLYYQKYMVKLLAEHRYTRKYV